MPTYDYVCGACGHAFEHFQEMSAKRLRTCPRCKKPRLERQVGTGAGLIFKGSGFYITDYRRGGGGDAGAPAAEGKKTEAGGTGEAGASASAATGPKASPADKAASPGSAAAPAKAPAPAGPASAPKKASDGRSGPRRGA